MEKKIWKTVFTFIPDQENFAIRQSESSIKASSHDNKTIFIFLTLPFVSLTLYMGTKGGYYDSDDYDGHGTAHKVLIDDETSI